MIIVVKSTLYEAGTLGGKRVGEASGSPAPSSAEARHFPVHSVPRFSAAGSLPHLIEQLTEAQRDYTVG